MEKARRILDAALLSVLVLQGFSLIFVIVLAVFYRYILGSALSWPEEFAGILFVWYTLLGIVVLVGSDTHIAFDIVEKYAPPIVGMLVKILSQLIVILYGVVMVIYGWEYLQLFPDETSPAAGINLSWVKVSIPVTGTLLVVYVALNIIQLCKSKYSERGGAQ